MYENCIERHSCNRYPNGCSDICYLPVDWSEANIKEAKCKLVQAVFPDIRYVEGDPGRDGLNGKDLEFKWVYSDTEIRLAVREKGTETWYYSPSLIGPKGEKGEKGDTGATGERGPRGLQGSKGEQGIQGVQGPTGPTGPRGPKGDTGEKGEPGKEGKDGADGQQGPKGDTAVSVTIGTVSEGTTASVTNSGTNKDLVLNFVIPKGEKGEKGDTGPKGADGSTILPIASATTLGGIKVGENLNITEDGTLNAQAGAEDVIIPYKTFTDYSDEEKTSIADKLLNCINAVKSLTKICYLEATGAYYPLSGIVNDGNNIKFIFIILEGFTQGQITYTISGTSKMLTNITTEVVNTVDSAMSDTSTNPVQNKIVKQYVDNLVGNIETVLQTINSGSGV